jgi:uncharacterized protein (TIGR03435 family)
MIAELINHLWQSTLFAVVAWLLTMAFRKNRAQVRYWLWLSASLKFLVPFSLLMSLGSHLEWPAPAKKNAAPAVLFAIKQVAQPFPETISFAPSMAGTPDGVPIAIPLIMIGLWACGFSGVALIRFRGWLRIRAAVRSSAPIDIPVTVDVRSSPGLLEPGVVGLFRPTLLLPAGIVQRLTPPQLETVLAHELCHVRRRDNITSAIHMIVEAVFWFHPLVWWIGARLVEERERACDESVLSLGSEPHDYAEAILNVCKLYVESPLACVSGVSGSDLKARIQAILAGRIAGKLTLAKKAVLVVAGAIVIAAPIAVGVMNAPAIRAQSAPAPKFEVVSVKPCPAGDPGGRSKNGGGFSPGTLKIYCQTVDRLIQEAYDFLATGKPRFRASPVPIEGAPAWINTERYTIEAKSESPQGRGMMNGPMMQALLEDRFKLKLRRVPREVPVYLLTVAKGGPKGLEPAKKGACVPFDFDNLFRTPGQSGVPCGMIGRNVRSTNGTLELYGSTMPNLAEQFSMLVGREVIDKTGLSGAFDFHVEVPVDELAAAPSDPAAPGPPADESALAFAAVRKLGLKLQSAKGTGEIFVIDHIERPSEN